MILETMSFTDQVCTVRRMCTYSSAILFTLLLVLRYVENLSYSFFFCFSKLQKNFTFTQSKVSISLINIKKRSEYLTGKCCNFTHFLSSPTTQSMWDILLPLFIQFNICGTHKIQLNLAGIHQKFTSPKYLPIK